MNRIDAFLELAVHQGGSDLHLVSGQMPRIRIHGLLEPVRFRALSPGDIQSLLEEFMTDEQRTALERDLAVDFAYEAETCGRFRVNAYRHGRGLAAALRVIPRGVPTLASLSMPSSIERTLSMPNGLILVTGPTGSGKSTTLAAMVDYLNTTIQGHVITLEDPIEYLHEHRRCVITQREIGTHAQSFGDALRGALREDPDAILVGELRDLETISLALTAAETGILVMGTLHTNGAVKAVDRIVNVFPGKRQDQVRTMLADSLRLVISQQLVRKADHTGRVAVADVLVNTTGVRAMLRQGHSHKIQNAISSGARSGMQSLDDSLKQLVEKGIVAGEEAWEVAIDRTAFERYVAA
jgi:twitching motility protein PilT